MFDIYFGARLIEKFRICMAEMDNDFKPIKKARDKIMQETINEMKKAFKTPEPDKD